MIRSLIQSCYLINLSFASLLLHQRGYRCYSPNINRYFISVDVTFFENSSFFSSAARPLVSDVLSIPLVLPSPDFPSPPTNVMTRPLKFILVVLILPQGLLLNHLLCHHHLLLRFRNHLMIYLLPFGKVLALLLTHILFIIFSAFIVYLYPTLPLSPLCLLSLLLTTLMRLFSSGLATARNKISVIMDISVDILTKISVKRKLTKIL